MAQTEQYSGVRLVTDLLSQDAHYTSIPEDVFGQLAGQVELPDQGRQVQAIAEAASGGAFDPRNLEQISGDKLGYRARWVVVRYDYYGLPWDITALRLESRAASAKALPWLVIINGGSANLYEFFTDPLNRAGMGQYLAQMANVLIVTIPGNFRYGGWTLPPSQRSPQYLLDREIAADELRLRHAIYTNCMEMEGLKRLIAQETDGDILIIGHSTSGELAFMAMDEPELAARLKRRFLGWGSGGPCNFRRKWEDSMTGSRSSSKNSTYPPLAELRIRNAAEYVRDGYIGPLNPCRAPGMSDEQVAARWLSLVDRNRPNIKQSLQDLEHRGIVEIQPQLEAEISKLMTAAKLEIDFYQLRRDLFATARISTTGYLRMIWAVGKWDKRHWSKTTPSQAHELSIADQFRAENPGAAVRMMVFDLPLTHYGHIEKPKEVAVGLAGAAHWLTQV
jgi:hypothetical protein